MKLTDISKVLFTLLVACLTFVPSNLKAYSILTHEAIIDVSWEKYIKPLLKKKYPQTTDAELKIAHSYAYGGSLMTDIGYSPYGSTYFTNLIHYVRTGDFVENLLSEAQNVNEYAYAVGALCHYMADSYGHSIGTNVVVPEVYPKIGEKYGKVVTYEEDHISHSRTEIGFDVLQLARGNYASQEFHDFIGFNVAVPVLERAFYKTYGEDVDEIFNNNIDHSVHNFRWAVNSLMPTVTRSAWLTKRSEIQQMQPGMTARKFNYHMHRKKYFAEFGRDRDRPEFRYRLLAFFMKIVPKIGPFRALRFTPITPEGEKQFIKSFDTVINHYTTALEQLSRGTPVKLANLNLDTGQPITPEEYKLADEAYCDLVVKLQENKFAFVTPTLKQNVLTFYSQADTAAIAKTDASRWKKASAALQQFKDITPITPDSLRAAEAIQDQKRLIKAKPKDLEVDKPKPEIPAKP